MEENTKIKSFADLIAWQVAHELVLSVYEATKTFPKEEAFGLTNQVRRASVSITSNIAEGFSRKSDKEKSQFFSIALGSLTEVQSQLMVARDVKYISNKYFDEITAVSIRTSKLINGLLKSCRNGIPNT